MTDKLSNSDEQLPVDDKNLDLKPPSSGYFRWQGLLGFVVCVGLLVAVLFVYAGPLIRAGIEKGGSWYWGAEVNVAKVELNWSPFKLSIIDFEATDPKVPTLDLVAFANATVSVDLWQSLLGKTLIHELVVDQVQLNKPRKTPGKVTITPDEGIFEGGNNPSGLFDDAKNSLPSVDDLLKQSDLKTAKAGLQLQQTYKTEKQALEALAAGLPDKQKIAQYQQAIKKLTDSKITSAAQLTTLKAEFDGLKAVFKADKTLLAKAREQLIISKDNISGAVKALKEAPGQDWQDLSQRYQLNDSGAQNITELIFGAQAKEYYKITRELYQRFKPLLNKLIKAKQGEAVQQAPPGRGRYVHFAEANPMPDWLVEKATINVVLEQGDFTININELNSQHWLRNKPTQVVMSSKNLLNTGALDFAGKLFISANSEVSSDANWTISGLALQQLPISQSKTFSLTLDQTNLQVEGSISFANKQITNKTHLVLNNSEFTGQAQNKAAKVVLDILTDVDTLAVDVEASGDMMSPDFSLHSPLDSIIYQAVKKQLKTKLSQFKVNAQAGLQQKLTEQFKLSASGSDDFMAFDSDFSNLEKALETLLKSELNDKIQETLKDKLLDKLGDLF